MSRLLDKIVGHDSIIKRFLAMFSQDRVGQCFLFLGPQGVGKMSVAMGLSQALLCEKDQSACGVCGSCLRVAHGQSESVKVIAPQGAQIKMDQAKEVLSFLSLRSIVKNQIVIIDDAHLLNPQAANSLLKSIEEPPAGSLFFLISPSLAGILPTIRSRSNIIHFHPVPLSQMAFVKAQVPEWALKSSRGSFARLNELFDESEQELRQQAAQLLAYWFEDEDFLLNEKWRPAFKDRRVAQKIFQYWSGFLRDAYLLKVGGEQQVVNVDIPDFLKKLERLSEALLLELWQEVLNLEREVAQNRDVQLILEKFWIENQEALRARVD